MASELPDRQSAEPGTLLGREAAAGNLGRALGYVGAGSLFTLAPMAPMAPLGTATLVLLVGAALSLVWWGRPEWARSPLRNSQTPILVRRDLGYFNKQETH